MKKYYLSTLVAFVSFAFLVFDISNYQKHLIEEKQNAQHIKTVSDDNESSLPKYCCNENNLFTPHPQKTDDGWPTFDSHINNQIENQIENQNRLQKSLF